MTFLFSKVLVWMLFGQFWSQPVGIRALNTRVILLLLLFGLQFRERKDFIRYSLKLIIVLH